MKIFPRDSSAKVGREDIFKGIIVNERLHEVVNDSGARVVNFAALQGTDENFYINNIR
jgi:hypothetical protein